MREVPRPRLSRHRDRLSVTLPLFAAFEYLTGLSAASLDQPPVPATRSTLAEVCQAAYSPSARSREGSVAEPLAILLASEAKPRDFEALDLVAMLEPQSQEDVQSVACIQQAKVRAGSYSGGEPAYQTNWEVRVARVSDQSVAAKASFRGNDPPYSVPRGGEGVGSPPRGLTVAWLLARLNSPAVLSHAAFAERLRSPMWIKTVAFSRDGTTLASSEEEEELVLWNLATRQPKRSVAAAKDHSRVASVVFTPAGRVLAVAAGWRGECRLFDGTSGALLGGVTHGGETHAATALAADGSLAASATPDVIKVWEPTGTIRFSLTPPSNASSPVLLFSPDGATLASSHGKSVQLWNLATGEPARALTGATGTVNALAFSPDGKTIAAATFDRRVLIWDVLRGTLRATLTGHRDIVSAVAFSPAGSTLASGGHDETVKLWDARTGVLIRTFPKHGAWISALAFAPDGSRLAAGGHNAAVKLWPLGPGDVAAK